MRGAANCGRASADAEAGVPPELHNAVRPRVGRVDGPAALALAVLLALAAALPAAAGRYEGVVAVTPQAQERVDTWHGYLDHRIHLANPTAAPHALTLILANGGVGFGHCIAEIRREVTIAANTELTVALPQPPLGFSGTLAVELDGRYRGEVALPYQPAMHVWEGGEREPPNVLVARTLNSISIEQAFLRPLRGPGAATTNAAAAAAAALPAGLVSRAEQRRTPSFVRAEAEVARWSESWLGFSRFDGVMLTADDWRAATDGTREALWRYVEAGGTLLVAGSAALPTGGCPSAAAGERLRIHYAGFGRCVVGDGSSPERYPARDLKTLNDLWMSAQARGGETGLPDAPPPGFRVIADNSLPVRALLLFMLAFVVLIGPVNMIVLYRRRRLTWLLWTIPLVSLLTTAVIALYALLSEGVTPYSRLDGLTVLDQGTHRAATLGMAGWYCPIAPGGGLRFGYETEVTPLVPRRRYGADGRSARTIDWTRDQHLASGWILARIPAVFQVRKAERRRERLQVRREAGALRAVNGLGGDIAALWVADGTGTVFAARGIAAGAEAALAPAPGVAPAGEALTLHRLAAQPDWSRLFATAAERPEGLLQPGTYVAVLDSCPFLDTGLARPTHAQRRSIVFGRFGPEDRP